MRMRRYIGIVLMLFTLGNTGYTQDQGKDESLDSAIKSFLQAVEKNPNYADAHYNLGILYSEKGMTEEAVAEYKKTLEIEPDFVKAHNNIGVIYYETGQFDEAIESLKKALATSPQYIEAQYNLGIVYHAKKNMPMPWLRLKRL